MAVIIVIIIIIIKIIVIINNYNKFLRSKTQSMDLVSILVLNIWQFELHDNLEWGINLIFIIIFIHLFIFLFIVVE